MLRPDDDERAIEIPARALLEQILIQLNLVEVLYLRLVGLQARRLAHAELETVLQPEVARIQAELRCAQAELERLGCRVRADGLAPERPVAPPRPGTGCAFLRFRISWLLKEPSQAAAGGPQRRSLAGPCQRLLLRGSRSRCVHPQGIQRGRQGS